MNGPNRDFQRLLEALRTHAAEGGRGESGWFEPPLLDGALHDPDALRDAFRRQDLNSEAERALLRGSLGELAAKKIQIDYTAAAGRAFAMRHMTPCRAGAHAAARRRGHGEATGVFTGEVLQYVQNTAASGG